MHKSPSTMNLPCRWKIFLISMWIQVCFVSRIHCKDGTANHLSREDVLLLKNEPDPKCFTRTQSDLTCFFETADNRTYDLLYKVGDESPPIEKRCEMSVQRTEEGRFLHICSFDSDVFVYVETHLKVVERNTNTNLYNRTIFVEDQLLLNPPFNVSLHQNGKAGQLQVSWHLKELKSLDVKKIYRVRYFSKGMGEKTKEAKVGNILESLVPGEEVEVQVAVKGGLDGGHWSRWSQPVRAMVPHNADNISLMCYTSDLQSITCQWNGSRFGAENEYKLFYKKHLSKPMGWTEWTECLADRSELDLCCFQGKESREVKVKLSSGRAPLSRTFYSQEFAISKSIKTSPPSNLRGTLEKDKLCLKWEAPLPSLSAHLQYEVGYQIKRGKTWLTASLKGPDTGTCLEVPTGGQYSVKLRAKPNGSIYSGHWSDWSDVLTGDTSTEIAAMLMLCIPVAIVVIIVICCSRYFSKLKLYIWPPVPNLDKVLQGFLTEINGQRWNPPITAKQCFEETTSSVVEIMSEDKVSGLGKPTEESIQLLSPEGSFSRKEQVDGSPGTEVYPDYVTLNKDSIILCPNGNKYVHKQVGEKEGPGLRDELFQTCDSSCSDDSACLATDFLNHSYLSLAESAHKLDCKVADARGPGNLYTNFPCG